MTLPRLDFGDRPAQLPGFFLDEAVEVVAHGDAELGVDFIVPLLEPGEKLDEAGQEGDEAGVVAAADTFLDINKIGTDRPGELDVPKERWVSFPHCEGEDGSLMIAWAGYDHLQLARAISAYWVEVQERLGGRDDPRLVPLLACLIELLPWLKQWHNEIDPEFGVPMGDYFDGFIQEESRNLGLTLNEVREWRPPERARGHGRKRSM